MKAIIVHRWSGSPGSDWYPWLKKELKKKGFEVVVPKLSPQHHPKIKEWVASLRKQAGKADENTIFVGHSIGCQTILRYLEKSNAKAAGVILVSGWFTLKGLEDRESETIAKPWVTKPINFNKVRARTGKVSVFLSDNDPYVEYEENAKIFKGKLKAKVFLKKGKKHFTKHEGTAKVPFVLKEALRFSR